MRYRDYLNYLIGRMQADQQRALGAHSFNGFGAVTLNKGTYVWKFDNRFRNAAGYRLKMRHAASGAAGAFHFIVFHDKMEPGKPTMRMESPLNSDASGSVSQWTFNSDEETLFIGLRIPNDNTVISMRLTAPAGFRGLDPHWFTGPVNASGSQLQPGSPGDVPVVFQPGQTDTGSRFPGLRIETATTGAAGLKDYYHLDFTTGDASEITEPGMCIEILLQWIQKISPGGIAPFVDRAAWDAGHPDAGDRAYLDYLIERFTRQPLNKPVPDTLPDRLSAFYRINFHAPDSSRAARLQWLINILQQDLHGRNVFFHFYQAWLNEQQKKRFPENFYTHRVPLIEPKEVPPATLSETRERLPAFHSTQLVMECLQRLYGLDDTLFEARKQMALGEHAQAERRLAEAERALAFLVKHNSILQSKLTTSQHLQQLVGEKGGVLFNPDVRQQLRDRALLMVHPDVGGFLANAGGLLFSGASVPPVPGQQESAMYTRRPGRPKTQGDALMKDVRQPFPSSFEPLFDAVISKSGNLGNLANADKNAFLQHVRNLWLTVPHYLFFTLPLDFAECSHQMGDYERAERYLQLVLDHEHLYLEEQIVYRYLNKAIEVPYVSLMAGRNYAVWADRLVRRGGQENRVRARNLFRQARDLLKERIDPDNPAGRQWVTFCEAGLLKLNKNLNALGYPNDLVPVFRYAYLVNLAGEMTRHAIDAGRQAMVFMQQAEAAVRGELEAGQAVVLNETLAAAERLRVSEAQIRVEIAGLQRAQVDSEILNLDAKIEELSDPVFLWAAVATGFQSGLGLTATGAAIGGPVGALGGVIIGGLETSWSGPGAAAGGSIGGVIGGVAGIALGAVGGGFLGYAQGMAQWKAHESQLNDQKRAKAVLESFGRSIAERQVDLAEAGRQIAQANLAVADLRMEQARELAALIGTQAFNADQLYSLSRQMEEIYRTYLGYANEMAFLAEQSLEFELNERLDFIRFDYDEPALAGVLGAERLQVDIDRLNKAKVSLYDEKRLPVTVSVSLREEFPLAFFNLIQNGRAGFQTAFEYFNRIYPGAYQSRISRVELVFYALVPQQGLHGTLSSSGISYVMDEAGEIQPIATAPEKSIISKYRIADGQVFFFDPREHYHPFEGMGVVTDWTIDLPKSSNAIDYATIFDVHLVVHYTTLHDETLAQQVAGQLPPILQSARSFSLHNNFADGYYHLANEGSGTFTLTPGHFPADHANGTIRRVMLLYALQQDSTVGKVITGLTYRAVDGQSKQVNLALDLADPAGSNSGAEPFTGFPLYGEWEISVRLEDEAGAALPDLQALKNVIFFVEYDYERGSARYREVFERNPLTASAVVKPALSWSLERRGEADTVDVTPAPDGSVTLEIKNNGGADQWIKGPVVSSALDPLPVSPDTVVQWTQIDLAHALHFEVTLTAGDGREYPLTYAANASNHWHRKGWVNMGQTKGVLTTPQTFLRRLFGDFLTEYGIPPQRVTRLRVGHFSNRKTTSDHGGKVSDVAFRQQRLLPVNSEWAWSEDRVVLRRGSGGRFLLWDVGTPGHYTVACRVRAREANSRVDVWFGGGIYQVSVVPGSDQHVMLNIFNAPYAGAKREQIQGPKPAVISGQWFWILVAKRGRQIRVDIDGAAVAEFTDTVDVASSEMAIGSSKKAVEIDRILGS